MPNCTVIKLKAVDQRLAVVQQPLLASGDVGSVRVEYELDSFWDGYAPSGSFYASKHPEDIYEVPLVDGACVIPWEVLQEDGILYIGLRGVEGSGLIKTAAPVRYRVDKGSPSGDNTTREPTPDVYQQLMAAVGSAEAKATEAAEGVASVEALAESAAGEAAAAVEAAESAAAAAAEALAGLSTAGRPKKVTASGDVTVTFEDNTEYKLDSVRMLTMTFPSNADGKRDGISFHGFITFGTYMPVVTTTNTTTTPMYVRGDDINNAAPGETWEFSYHSAHMIWTNWG